MFNQPQFPQQQQQASLQTPFGNIGFTIPSGFGLSFGQQQQQQGSSFSSGGHGMTGIGMPYTRSYQPQFGRGIQLFYSPQRASDRLAIDFKCRGNIAFHLNIRMDERSIVRNSCVNGQWAAEERQVPNFPFAIGRTTQIYIMPAQGGFNVAFESQHSVTFAHRMPMHSIDSITIAGQGQLSGVQL